ncbi:Collagen alpha-5(VI) chain [Frankliniella fusca]|uniref:Collagen alpha-5(VI) chain n=1 Tax=Frankliniella fusca TaxID=407009 RepID=A0AAE1I3N5_9NEOP|nr:Collagen alpha-5(VI) chain [Frankliniella fusca]
MVKDMTTEFIAAHKVRVMDEDSVCSDYESITDGELASAFTLDLSDGHDPPFPNEECRILFLGKTVAGKTTLCKLLAGGEQEARLHIEERRGQLLIVDDAGKIGLDGTSTTWEPTLIRCSPPDWEDCDAPAPGPGRVARVALCDCPGFGDTRGWETEARQLQQVREVALKAAALKVVLVVEHASTVAGTCVDSFIGMVEYAVGLLRDLDKCRASACLVINKVPLTTRKVRGLYEPKKDEEFKEEARSFLAEVLSALRKGNRQAEQDGFLSKGCVKFVSDLLEDDRLALLRCPDEGGPVKDCELLQDSKQGVLALLRGLQWLQIRREDLGYPLSVSAGKEVSEQVMDLSECIPRLMVFAVRTLKEHYVSMFQSKNVEESRALLEEHMHCTVKQPGASGIPCQTCFGNDNLAQLLEQISGKMDKLRDLQGAYDRDVVSEVNQKLSEHKQAVHNFLQGWAHYFHFYVELSDLVWSYDVQSRQSDFDVSNVVDWGRARSRSGQDAAAGEADHLILSEDNVRNFVSVVRAQGLAVSPELDAVEWEPAMLESVNALLAAALRHRPRVLRVGDKAEVRGECVVLSSAVRDILDLFADDSCSERWPRQITILAHDTMFIDCSVNAAGHRLRLAVLAPRWEVIKPCINICLDGSTPHSENRLRPGASNRQPGDNGSDGAPGLPGGSAGAFLGAWAELVNGRHLKISACGGKGEDGKNGTGGANGKHGDNATPAFYSESRQSKMNDPSFVFGFIYSQRWRTFYGFDGEPGGDGGDGGKGGSGGLPGEVARLLPTDETSDFDIIAVKGEDGEDGLAGTGGRGGSQGKNKTARQHFAFFLPVGVSVDDPTEQTTKARDGRPGKKGGNSSGRRAPEPAESFTVQEKIALLETYRETYSEPGNHLHQNRRAAFRKFLTVVHDQLDSNSVSRWITNPSSPVCERP